MTGWVPRVEEYFSDPKVFFDIHFYWYHHLNDNRTSQSQIRSYLSSKGVYALQDKGKRVVIGEAGIHGDATSTTNYTGDYDSRDKTWYTNLIAVCKTDKIDLIMQSFQPGKDFPGFVADGYTSTFFDGTPAYSLNYFNQQRPTLQYYGGEIPDPPDPIPAPNRYLATTTLPIQLSSSNQWRAEVNLAVLPSDIVSRLTSVTLTYTMYDVDTTDEVEFTFNNVDQGFIAVSGDETERTYTKSISPGIVIAGQNVLLFDGSTKQWGSQIREPIYIDIEYDETPQVVATDTGYTYRKVGATGALYMLDRVIIVDTGSQVPAAQSGYTMKRLSQNLSGKDIYIEYKVS
jgi:hypothetical protein